MGVSLISLSCRISDRALGPVRGVEAFSPLVAERLGEVPRKIGSAVEPFEAGWADDLAAARGCLLEAGGQVEDALAAGRVPVLVSSDCALALTTLPTVARLRPDARVLWLDAHGDFNTPDTTASGYLGGMALAGACRAWESGFDGEMPAERVVLAGVRDLEAGEREALERSAVTVIGSSLETLVYVKNALDRAPVFVHLDLDVLDPQDFPAWIPAEGGLRGEKLYDLLEAVCDECELVGLEVTVTCGPTDRLEIQAATSTALHAMGPLFDAVKRGARVSH